MAETAGAEFDPLSTLGTAVFFAPLLSAAALLAGVGARWIGAILGDAIDRL